MSDEADRDAKAPAKKKRRAGPVVGLVVLLVLVGLPVAAWALRSTIATSLARSALEAQGIACDDRFAVDVGAGFGEASVGPTRCARSEGNVESVELMGTATVQLEGLTPTEVTAESLRLTLRDEDVEGGSRWSSQLRQLRLEQRVAGLVKGLSELSTFDVPPARVGELEVTRGSDRIASASGVVITPGAPMQVRATRIRFDASLGSLTLTEVTGDATASEVHLEGQAEGRAGIGFLGFSQSGPFSMDARGLDGSPRFTLEF